MTMARFHYWNTLFIVLIPVLISPLLFLDFTANGLSPTAARCGFVVAVMAVYWLFELLPLPVTALLPIVLFPMLGILSTKEVSLSYFEPVNMLMVGGLIVAIAIEETDLHRRIALRIMLTVGK